MSTIGLSLSSRGGFAPQQFAAYARTAEERGFTAAFATENYSDSLALAQAMAGATSRITVGTAIANVYARHPALLALTAATIDELSGGRFLLGLGTVSAAYNQGVLGLPATPPLRRVRESLGVIRAVLAGGPVTFSGEEVQVAEFRPYRRPLRPDLPIYLGALLPRMLRLAGELADGVILNLSTVQQVRAAIATIGAGARIAGREVRIACVLPCCVSSDLSAARRAARELVAGYAWHPAAGQTFAESGFAEEMLAIGVSLRAGDREGALARVSDAMAAALVVHGPVSSCQQQVEAYLAAGVEMPILMPVPIEGDWDASIHSALDAFAQ